MAEDSQLKAAIAALDANRITLGDAVVDASIAVLQERLATIASAGQPEQRKLVTVLFVDIVDWTPIGKLLDPEDLRLIQRPYFQAVTSVVASYGGIVEKYIGDAVLAVFGVPTAHEDDAERAVRAALAILPAVARALPASTPQGFPLRIRIGIHTGLVMASGGVGSRDTLVTGEAINLASRLQTAAAPGTVVVSEDTCRLVSDTFDCEPLPAIAVKGFVEPVHAYRIAGLRAVASATWTVGGLSSPLVGRQVELAALEGAVARLADGQGAVAALIGDAGVGKSRLVAEAFRTPAAQTVDLVTGRCLSFGHAIPYHLWLDVLRNAAQIPADASPEQTDSLLRTWIESTCPREGDEVYDTLARLLSLSPETGWTLPDERVGETPFSKAAVFRAVEILVRSNMATCPLAIVCEDLQWADPSSIDLLEHLARLTEQMPLLLVCTFRPEADRPVWNLIGHLSAAYQSTYISLWLQPLSAADSERLVASLLGRESTTDGSTTVETMARAQKLLWRVLGRAEGNPYFLEEVIRSLIQSGALVRDAASEPWQLRVDDENLAIPETVQSVLGARIDSLSPASRRVLQVAAVLGRDFSLPVLGAILPGEHALARHVDVLVGQNLIIEHADGASPKYRFCHALVCEVAYGSLLRSERRRYHREVATVLESVAHGSDRNVETLALHWQRGGDPTRASGYYAQSGDRARFLGSSVEATRFYQTALELLGGVRATAAPISTASLHEKLGDVYLENLSAQEPALAHYTAFIAEAGAPVDQARAARKLASTCLMEGDLAAARRHFETALDYLADQPADPEANRVHCGLAYLFISQGDLEQAGVHVRQSIGLARRIEDRRGLADAYRLRGILADIQGNPRLALAYARRCLALYGQLHDLPQLAQANNNVAHGCRQLGLLTRAQRHLQAGLEIAQRIGDTRDQALLLLSQGELLLDRGLAEEAIGGLLEALPLAQESGAITRVIQTHRTLGEAFHQVSRLEDARRHLEMALALCQETRHHRFYATLLLDLAHLAVSKGEVERCEQLLGLVREAAGAEPTIPVARETWRVRGRLALRQEQWSDAAEALEASLSVDSHEPVPSRANACYLLALAYAGRQQPGDRENACQQLRVAGRAFRRMSASSRLAEVRQLQRRIECRRDGRFAGIVDVHASYAQPPAGAAAAHKPA